MELERVKKENLDVGSPIPWNAFDENGVLLLRKGQVLESRNQIEILLQNGLFYVLLNDDPEPEKQVEETVQSPFKLIGKAEYRLDNLFGGVTAGITENFSMKILSLCKTLQQACDIDIDASIGAVLMDSKYQYSIVHPVHIAIICEIIARELKWPDNERLSLLAAALTSNVAMIDLQDRLCTQKAPLSDVQKQRIQEHPERGIEFLSSAGVTDRVWLDGVLYHHEAMDGSGYPAGLKGNAIPTVARFISVGDVFSAAVSKRAYRAVLAPNEAMREIYLSGGHRVENDLVNLCVKIIGIYPPGTFVRLANGEIAIVTRRGEKAHVPIVYSLAKGSGRPFHSPIKRDCNMDKYAIKEVVTDDNEKVAVDKCKLWECNF